MNKKNIKIFIVGVGIIVLAWATQDYFSITLPKQEPVKYLK